MTNVWRFLPVAVLAAGCGGGGADPVAVHPVAGKVVVGGKPAAGVHVYFYPTTAPGVPEVPAHPHGVTGADGTFRLSTFGADDGAAEGGYQVVLFWPPPAKEDEEESDSDRLLGWYDVAHSKLTARVKPGANELPAFALPAATKPPGESEGVPGRN